ncbi:hypothetical protein GCM10010124_21880 [Pilimelia terevasa]|uniref:Uncharacterized protein n=1 Tax=Pilimelia terevasa TaxID=53372 RepID=A0A8J3BM01_9ACTN|nr:Crp/Fnr family transcriptional regulator [Pilimelia terevasa]GGK28781.1 hypothetical protein GCM10010124_21880 [Pilimelia terevasa]
MTDDPRYTTGFLAYLSWAAATRLIAAGTQCSLAARHTLFAQGTTGDFVYLIHEGLTKVVRHEDAGRIAILTLRGPGDLVGDLAAADGHPRLATVTALTRLTCTLLSGRAFRGLLQSAEIAISAHRYTSHRLREADHHRAELAALPVRQRLARLLLRLPGPTPPPLPQQDLADLIGASRNAVVNALAELRRSGCLDTGPRRLRIRDRNVLMTIAGLPISGQHPRDSRTTIAVPKRT